MGDGKIVKIAKGAMHINAHKDIHFYAKNINANAGSSVGETAEGGVVFGTPQTTNWDMPNVEFPNHNYTPVAATPSQAAAPPSAAPQTKQHTAAPEAVEESEIESDEKIKLTIAVFFDGTLNNKYNTVARWLYNNIGGKTLTEKEKEQAKTYAKRWVKKLRGSYENDLSNVARIEEYYIPKNPKPNHFVDKIYVEGVGTFNGTKDDLFSAIDGEGKSGIRAKIRKSIQDIALKINTKTDDELVIEELIFNVYGFSRGAATARNFIHEITQEAGAYKAKGSRGRNLYYTNPYGLLGEAVNTDNIEKLTVNFAGLFDTVSAHDKNGVDKGLTEDAHDDVEELHLDAVGKAHKIVHFSAADEHRQNFALTDISTSRTIADLELSFPGVHADIGGCYTNGIESVEQIIIGFNQTRKKEQERLMAQGWFKKEQFTNGYVTPLTLPSRAKYNLSGERYISRNYSFIPLELMAILSNTNDETKSIKLKRLNTKYHIYSTDPNKTREEAPELDQKQKQLLNNVKNRLFNYALRGDAPMQFYTAQELLALSDDFELTRKQNDSKDLFELRNQFLHFSANFGGLGMDPNIEDGKRIRKIFHG